MYYKEWISIKTYWNVYFGHVSRSFLEISVPDSCQQKIKGGEKPTIKDENADLVGDGWLI